MAFEKIELRRVRTLGNEITPLITEADCEGHLFMRRLLNEWASGANRFQAAGECLLGAYAGDRLVGVAGLNRDPYTSADGIGRLRHVYVMASARRLGVGTILVTHIREYAGRKFSTLRLRTTSAEAAAFYERLGFSTARDRWASHVLELVRA